MKKQKQYRYIGRNGIITSKVLLEGINHIPMMHIEAEPGFLLLSFAYFDSVQESQSQLRIVFP